MAFLYPLSALHSEVVDGVKLAPCELTKDPKTSPPSWSLCLRGRSGWWTTQNLHLVEGDSQPPWLSDNSGSAHLLLGSWVMVGLSGYARYSQSRTHPVVRVKDARREYAIVQLGNAAIHRHRFMAGVSPLLFGLHRNLNSSWTNRETDRQFYGSPVPMAAYVYDNQKDLTAYVSVGHLADRYSSDVNRKQTPIYGGSFRVNYDISALEGTRLESSAYSDTDSHRRVSLALLNVNGKGEKTSLEVVRRWTEYPYDPEDFTQLIRFNWEGIAQSFSKFHAQYDDIPDIERIGIVGINWEALERASLNVMIGYRRDEIDRDRSSWLAVTGIEVAL